MFKVECHNNSKKYFESIEIKPSELHVTSNTSLNIAFREAQLKKSGRFPDSSLLSMDEFKKKVMPVWENGITDILMKSELEKILIGEIKHTEELLTEFDLDELKETEKYIKFLSDNISLLYGDFKIFAAAGIKEIKNEGSHLKNSALNSIYSQFIKNEYVKKCLESLQYAENINAEIKTIYFYNLSYIDFSRFILVQNLYEKGYKVIFRIPYFKGLKNVNRCWDITYRDFSSIFDFKEENAGTYTDYDIKYINYLEGEEPEEDEEENVKVMEYREAADIKKAVKDKITVGLNKDSTDIFTEKSKKEKNLIDFPAGRFMKDIYKCSLIENKDVKMDFNLFTRLITSNWINAGSKGNGSRFFRYLTENQSFFEGVKTINEIIERIEVLKDVLEAGSIFEDTHVNMQAQKNSTKLFLSNPFKVFSYTDFKRYDAIFSIFSDCAKKLKRFLLDALKEEDGLIDCREHFRLLKNLFGKNPYFSAKLNSQDPEEKEMYQDLRNYLNYYLMKSSESEKRFSKKTLKEIAEYNLTGKKDEEVQKIYSLDHLEGLILREKLFENTEKKIFIINLSAEEYRKYIKKIKINEKIFTFEDYKNIIKNSDLDFKLKEQYITVAEMESKVQNVFENYIKFAAANLLINFDGKIEFSWISQLKQDSYPSILYKHLESLYGKKDVYSQELDLEELELLEEEKEEVFDKKDCKNFYKEFPPEAYLDMDFCMNKFLYTTVLNDYPVYSQNYQQKMIFSQFASIIKSLMPAAGSEDIEKFLFPLFPQWTDTEKKSILEESYARPSDSVIKYFNGINYPAAVKKLYISRSSYRNTNTEKRYNAYSKNDGNFNDKTYYAEFLEKYREDDITKSGKYCGMCPHNFICKKGVFGYGIN